MTCKHTLDLMQAFGDGELDGESQARVRDHLRTCPDCRRTYDERRALVQALAVALAAEAVAPPDLSRSVWQRLQGPSTPSGRTVGKARALTGRRPMKIAFSVAGLAGLILALTWTLFGRDLALARAIDQAMRQVKSAHFVAVEGERKITVWATQEAELVASDQRWMIAKGGRAYLFDPGRKRVTVTKGPLAQLQLLRGLNVLLLSARVRGQAVGEPSVTKKTVRLADGRRVIRISASGRARVMGEVRTFQGAMLVDPATNLILSGEVIETRPSPPVGEEARRRSTSRITRISVDSIAYNAAMPAGIFNTRVPPGWTVLRK